MAILVREKIIIGDTSRTLRSSKGRGRRNACCGGEQAAAWCTHRKGIDLMTPEALIGCVRRGCTVGAVTACPRKTNNISQITKKKKNAQTCDWLGVSSQDQLVQSEGQSC